MPLWGKNDAANNAPKYVIEAGTTARGNTSYGNTTVGAFKGGKSVGTFGVDTTETSLSDMVSHAGWVVVRQGSGFVESLTITTPGTGYANTDTVAVSGGLVNAAFTIGTNGSGVITSVTRTNPGSGFLTQAAANVVITTAGGTGAALTAVMGGRVGRRHTETLVAMSSITGDGDDDAIFPDA